MCNLCWTAPVIPSPTPAYVTKCMHAFCEGCAVREWKGEKCPLCGAFCGGDDGVMEISRVNPSSAHVSQVIRSAAFQDPMSALTVAATAAKFGLVQLTTILLSIGLHTTWPSTTNSCKRSQISFKSLERVTCL